MVTYSDRQPARYSWVDFARHSAGLFKDSMPWIDPSRMQPENIIRFNTRDGRQLDAYLTLPAGASREHPAPLVVLPHGGPWVRDEWGFDNEAQFLASRGYAVLKPNYRGSPGMEWKFPGSDEWNFVKISHDVTDATKAMVATGLVDPARIAIMGGSFGGYLRQRVVDEPRSTAVPSRSPACSTGPQLIADKKYDYTQFGSPAFGLLMRNLGDPRKEEAKFDEIAPVRHVDRIRVPVFVTHGKDDPVADLGQSTRLISELEGDAPPRILHSWGRRATGCTTSPTAWSSTRGFEAFLSGTWPPFPARWPQGRGECLHCAAGRRIIPSPRGNPLVWGKGRMA